MIFKDILNFYKNEFFCTKIDYIFVKPKEKSELYKCFNRFKKS